MSGGSLGWVKLGVLALVYVGLTGCDLRNEVGRQPSGIRLPNGQEIAALGEVSAWPGRPVDMIASRDGRHLFIKDFDGLRVVELASGKVGARIASPGGASLLGLALSADGQSLYFTNATNGMHEFDLRDPLTPKLKRTMSLPGVPSGNSFPCGVALSADGKEAYVALSRNNSLAIVDLESGRITATIPVGVAPCGVAVAKGLGRLLVTNQGGSRPTEGQKVAPSAGTPVAVDERGVAIRGSVSIIDLKSKRVLAELATELQPTELVVDEATGRAYISETNNDSVAVVDVKAMRRTGRFTVHAADGLPYGSMPTGLTLLPGGRELLVTLAGCNLVNRVDVRSGQTKERIPTDWYPVAAQVVGRQLLVLNNKGFGSRPDMVAEASGTAYSPAPLNSHAKASTLRRMAWPLSAEVRNRANATVQRLSQADRVREAFDVSDRPQVPPVAVPAKLGEPSHFQHVVYVIKENRTYDQMFGDMPGAKGLASLNIFKDREIPNHRQLARDFVLLDNYYCNGVLSADGHSWATEGNVTPYLNRAFGGFNRSYTFGDDPITYSRSGFVWDAVLKAGLTFRNYGEMDYAEPVPPMNGRQVMEKYLAGEKMNFSFNIGIERLRRYSCREYPGWNMSIPDMLRMDVFLKEFAEYEKNGGFPNLTIVYLPQDHAGGAVTPRAHMADNDWAVGRLVEAISKSRYWKNTVIFINEDDPQAGTDHVDGHRSICLVVSPYSRKRGTVSDFYNQTSVLHTIHRILGVPPMNMKDAASPLMTACFGDRIDLSPYTARKPEQPIDEYTTTALKAAPDWAHNLYAEVSKIDLSRREVQTPREMDLLNRWVWHSSTGFRLRYPSEWAGAHGRGLGARGLKFAASGGVDEDDD